MTLALLDGDIIAYRSAAAAQEAIDWGDGQDGLTVNSSAAVSNAHSMTRTWLALSRCTTAVICLSPLDGGNFRRDLTAYKEDRGSKPQVYWDVIASLEGEWETRRIPRLEADDVMGIMSTSPKLRGAVIVSIDKDMETIPGKLLNPLKDKRPRRVTQVAADRYWMSQTLMGDPVDGYKGCPGVGKIGAAKLLQDARSLPEMWEIVRDTYVKKGRTEADAILQAQLARILRREDYDKEKGTITVWHPRPKARRTIDINTPGS